MFRFAATLIAYIALLLIVYTTVFVIIGYYPLNQPTGALGAYGTFVGVAVMLAIYVHFRRKYLMLKKKYAALFALYEKLGVA